MSYRLDDLQALVDQFDQSQPLLQRMRDALAWAVQSIAQWERAFADVELRAGEVPTLKARLAEAEHERDRLEQLLEQVEAQRDRLEASLDTALAGLRLYAMSSDPATAKHVLGKLGVKARS